MWKIISHTYPTQLNLICGSQFLHEDVYTAHEFHTHEYVVLSDLDLSLNSNHTIQNIVDHLVKTWRIHGSPLKEKC